MVSVTTSTSAGRAPRLWLLRHAAVEGASGRCYGASDLAARPAATRAAADDFARRWPAGPEASGIAVSDAGRADDDTGGTPIGDTARRADPTLVAASSQFDPATATATATADDVRLWCSPLRRCTALAAAVVERLPGLGPVRIDARLAEMDFGAWEGLPWDAIGRDAFDAWTADFADARVGGHGESTRLFMARVGAAWDAWRASGRDAVWVTHAGVMRAVMLLDAGVRCPERASEWPAQPVGHGEWLEFGRGG